MIYVRNILCSNFVPLQLSSEIQVKDKNTKIPKKQKQRCVTFTFFGKGANCVAKPFKKTDLNVAYKTKNCIYYRLKPKYLTKKETYIVLIYIS